ncbi:MAG: DUF998 domain-containing protein [Thermoleophilia bacterium]
MDRLRSPYAAAVVLAGVLAAVAYAGFLFDLFDDAGGLDLSVVSSLETSGEPEAGLLRTLDVVSGLLTLALVPFLAAALPPGRWRAVTAWSLVVFAAGGILAALVPLPCADGTPGCPAGAGERAQAAVHDAATVVSTLAVLLSAAAVVMALRRTGPAWMTWAALLVVAVGVTTGVAYVIADLASADDAVGIAQRLQILCVSAWLVCIGVHAAGPIASRRSASPP